MKCQLDVARSASQLVSIHREYHSGDTWYMLWELGLPTGLSVCALGLYTAFSILYHIYQSENVNSDASDVLTYIPQFGSKINLQVLRLSAYRQCRSWIKSISKRLNDYYVVHPYASSVTSTYFCLSVVDSSVILLKLFLLATVLMEANKWKFHCWHTNTSIMRNYHFQLFWAIFAINFRTLTQMDQIWMFFGKFTEGKCTCHIFCRKCSFILYQHVVSHPKNNISNYSFACNNTCSRYPMWQHQFAHGVQNEVTPAHLDFFQFI